MPDGANACHNGRRDALDSCAHKPTPVARGGPRGACLRRRWWDAGVACVGDGNRADLGGTVVPPPAPRCARDGTGPGSREDNAARAATCGLAAAPGACDQPQSRRAAAFTHLAAAASATRNDT